MNIEPISSGFWLLLTALYSCTHQSQNELNPRFSQGFKRLKEAAAVLQAMIEGREGRMKAALKGNRDCDENGVISINGRKVCFLALSGEALYEKRYQDWLKRIVKYRTFPSHTFQILSDMRGQNNFSSLKTKKKNNFLDF